MEQPRQRIAVIGTGIAGMASAWLLHRAGHQVTVFEAGAQVGGHTNTVPVTAGGRTWAIDTGFIVFNDRTYPHFCALLAHLGVASQPTTMSFSVRNEMSGLEYNGHSLDTLFAQRRNLLRPRFWGMLRDILRFGREAPAALAGDPTTTLDQWLDGRGYGAAFIDDYLLPMAAAIWSSPSAVVRTFPVRHLVRFFHNHGMLTVADRPQWRVVRGGSWNYASVLTAPFREHIRLRTPVRALHRDDDGVAVQVDGQRERFDHVVVAAHSDQALRLLADPTADETAVLGAIPYQENVAVLHRDAALMPRARKAWAAWNHHRLRGPETVVALTYWMNELQGLDAPEPYLVTLNRTDIDPATIIHRVSYHHPVFTAAAVAAQARWSAISGVRRTHYCGAYWGWGFHEDGLASAVRVAATFGVTPPWTAVSPSPAALVDGAAR